MNYKGRNAHDFWLGVYGVSSVQLRVVRMLPRVLRACGTAVPKVTGRTLQKPGWRSGCGCSAAVIVVCQASNKKLCVHFFVQCSRGSKFWFCFEGLPINLLAIWKSFADPDPGPIWICYQKVLLAVFRSQSGRSLSMSHLSPRMNALWITLDNLWNRIRSFLKWGSPESSKLVIINRKTWKTHGIWGYPYFRKPMGLPMGLLQKLDQAKDLQAEIGHEEDDLDSAELRIRARLSCESIRRTPCLRSSISKPRCRGSWEEILPVPLLCQNSYWKWPFIVDIPIKNGDFPQLC